MNAQPSTPNLAAIKQRQQKAWSAGDYSKIGVIFVVIAEMLCEAVDLRPGRRVLDVTTGHGNADPRCRPPLLRGNWYRLRPGRA
jgi:hypothetical protein